MRELTGHNLLLIAVYINPGLLVLLGLSHHSDLVATWLGQSAHDGPTVAGFLYVTLASIQCGFIINAIRWLILDTIHHRTGIQEWNWDFSKLQDQLQSYEYLAQTQWRYYKAYGNSTIGIIVYSLCHMSAFGLPGIVTILTAGLVIFALVLVSRNTLQNFTLRVSQLLGSQSGRDSGKS